MSIVQRLLIVGAATAAFSAPALAEEDLNEMCVAFGELAIHAFEARSEGLSLDSAREAALSEMDMSDEIEAELGSAAAAVVEGAYAMDLPSEEAELETMITDYAAEMIVACEEGLAS